MASTTTGLPDRYRPLDQVGPDEATPTGVIQCWRAKDRILNRDVAIRVHVPAGPAAHAWITRALTAGGLATPALAMVYDASEGSGDPQSPGGAAYVVNEWIDGETLAERLSSGPMPERDVRLVLRRLAEGVAEAHRVGLAVGGLSLENVVLRPNGLVGLRAVPAAAGTFDGDVTALGELLSACLTGVGPGARPATGPSDLVILARRARSTEPGQKLSSVAAMAALLAERPRTGPSPAATAQRGDDTDGGRRRRPWDRRGEGERPVRLEPGTLPPVPPVRPAAGVGPRSLASAGSDDTVAVPGPRAGATRAVPGTVRGPSGDEDEPFGVLHAGAPAFDDEDDYPDELADHPEDPETARRHRLVVVGLPLLALAVVIALAWWLGTSVLSVAGTVGNAVDGSIPPSSTVEDAPAEPGPEPATAGAPVAIAGAEVFDPFGDGEPENDAAVPLSYDGDPATAWSTLDYRGSPAFGNLKPGVGVVYDLGETRQLAGVTVQSPLPGATVEVRTADTPADSLDGFAVAAEGTLADTTELTFAEPVDARYVLLWVTGLTDGPDGFTAEVAEVEIRAAG
ncbi:hypothetical protein [Blastococcus montanus]|uniref:hypothetical protein n=1 Tax=Blastococcus montanus TaxID=3144973 RepID=UPI003208A0B4